MNRFKSTIFLVFIGVVVSEIGDSKTAAILPWSEYQRRLRIKAHAAPVDNLDDDFGQKRRSQLKMTEAMLEQAALAELQALAEEQRRLESQKNQQKFSIRPQSKKKVAEPADYQRSHKHKMLTQKEMTTKVNPPDYHPPVSPEQYPYLKMNNMNSPAPFYNTQSALHSLTNGRLGRPNTEQQVHSSSMNTNYKGSYPTVERTDSSVVPTLSRIQPSRMESLLRYEKSKNSRKFDGSRSQQFVSQEQWGSRVTGLPKTMNQQSMREYEKSILSRPHNTDSISQQLPSSYQHLVNGVEQSNSWMTQPAPKQFAATSFIDPQLPLNAIGQGTPDFSRISQLPSLPVDETNLVNAIFSQSQQRPLPSLNPGSIPGIQQVPLQTNGISNPLESLLARGSPLDQISKFAKQLLNGDNGNSDLLAAGLRALQNKGMQVDGAATETRSSPTMMEKLFSSAANAINNSIKEQERTAKLNAAKEKDDKKAEDATQEETSEATNGFSKETERSLGLLDGVPKDQRELLEKAIKNGELDPEALKPALKQLVKEDTKEDSKKEKESRLLEWIQQNRPSKQDVVVASDKLPFYGQYCGSFQESVNSERKYRPTGAIWAVDNRRLIVSKFYFQPRSLAENITFWGGPNTPTGDPTTDIFPSENGFYLRPQPIDISVFSISEPPPLEAKVRKAVDANITINGATPVLPAPVLGTLLPNIPLPPPIGRKKRESVMIDQDIMPPKAKSDNGTIHLVVKGGMVQVQPNGESSIVIANSTSEDPSTSIVNPSIIAPAYIIRQPEEDPTPDPRSAAPLEWYAGFQPLLLTLPDHKWLKTTHWIALRDHNRQETVARVLIPNGPAFQVPGVVQLRALTPNLLFNISSGPIRVLDTKTIEITGLNVKSDGAALWFMIGKNILPNAGGHIVPLYDERTGKFDCESLRDYKDETVTLRLPGTMDIKDVFWFSVFSIPTAVSYSHIYLPYNDMHLPPDMKGLPTPRCQYKDSP